MSTPDSAAKRTECVPKCTPYSYRTAQRTNQNRGAPLGHHPGPVGFVIRSCAFSRCPAPRDRPAVNRFVDYRECKYGSTIGLVPRLSLMVGMLFFTPCFLRRRRTTDKNVTLSISEHSYVITVRLQSSFKKLEEGKFVYSSHDQ